MATLAFDPALTFIETLQSEIDRLGCPAIVHAKRPGADLDYTLQRPVNTLAKRQCIGTRKADRDSTIAALGKRYGIFYFFAQSCAACDVFSPILKSVADSHGIHVMAISTDGGPSSTFRNYVVDSG